MKDINDTTRAALISLGQAPLSVEAPSESCQLSVSRKRKIDLIKSISDHSRWARICLSRDFKSARA